MYIYILFTFSLFAGGGNCEAGAINGGEGCRGGEFLGGYLD